MNNDEGEIIKLCQFKSIILELEAIKSALHPTAIIGVEKYYFAQETSLKDLKVVKQETHLHF